MSQPAAQQQLSAQWLRPCLALLMTMAIMLPAAAQYKAARTAFGDPDLQGLWSNASLTTLERQNYVTSLVVSAEQASAIERSNNAWFETDRRPTDPGVGAPAAGGDVRGYNSFWLDRGSKLARVRGEIRTSWVIAPATGRIPYSAQARLQLRERARPSSEGPETRSLGDRCIVGYGSTSGPPMLNVLYNNNYQIVQAPGIVAIVVEMNHDARLIRIGGVHPPAHVQLWMGDSIGHWDGDTLVVETTNLHPGQSFTADVRHFLYLPPTAKVIERFTRVATDQLLYEFSVADEAAYTQTWRGEMVMSAAKGPMYEYACHEGNHSLPNILRGARYEEGKRESATR